jgi:anti-sigma B factor antagonist
MQDSGRPVTVIAAGEELDVSTGGAMRDRLRRATEDGAGFIVADLTATRFLDSTGLGVLVGGLRRAWAAGCGFGIACPYEPVRRVFQISGLTRVLDVRDSVESFTSATADG